MGEATSCARGSYGPDDPRSQDEATREVVLTIHWRGGQHSQLRVRKPKSGEHGCRTPDEALAVMRTMATRWSDVRGACLPLANTFDLRGVQRIDLRAALAVILKTHPQRQGEQVGNLAADIAHHAAEPSAQELQLAPTAPWFTAETDAALQEKDSNPRPPRGKLP
jgi:hypothetical protein